MLARTKSLDVTADRRSRRLWATCAAVVVALGLVIGMAPVAQASGVALASTQESTAAAQWTAAGIRAELASEQLDAANAAVDSAVAAQRSAAALVVSSALAVAPAQRKADDAAAAARIGRQALSPFAAAVHADQAQLAAYAAAAFEGAMPSNIQLVMSASSSQNLLDQQQAIDSVVVSHDRVLERSKNDLRALAAKQAILEQREQAASADAQLARAAHSSAMTAKIDAEHAKTAAMTAVGVARQRRSAAEAEVAQFHALYDKLSAAQQAADASAASQSAAQSAAFVRRYTTVHMRAGVQSISGLTDSQVGIARQIAGVAVARGLGERGALIGIMTAITESTLINVDHGDLAGPSSIGVFQQMTSWGSLAERTDPAQAAGLFFDRLVNVPNWQDQSPWVAAQAVQQSGFPDGSNYEGNLVEAQSITSALLVTATPGGDSTSAPISAPNPQAQIAVDFALAQIGKTFAYGATGPQAFDSSGLTFTSWAQAGISIPRASFQQAALPTVALTELQPGDLITANVPVSHVAIYVGDGMAVSAASEQLGIVEVPVSKVGAHPTAHRVQP